VRAVDDGVLRLYDDLRPHALVEEQGLFPAMASDFPGQIAELEAEHRLIEAPLTEAVRAAGDGEIPADPSWPGRLTEALTLLREHIFKEQDGVFPAALATLGTPDWEKVDAARLAAAALPAAPAPNR
jgi:hemerythrin-like domain-containing protein